MCGILGIISKTSVDNSLFEKALSSIKHRGPDDTGIFYEENLALGHQRLSILDLSANGHQPMFSACGNYCIIFNGEIYNHLSIRGKLNNKYHFNSSSDTETLLYGFIEYGTEILNMMNGIFAFAIYHIPTQNIFIARDQFGVKPLYYYYDDTKFIMGSELKSFLPFSINTELNETSIAAYVNYLYNPGENTPFKRVLKLLPGHFIQFNKNNFAQFEIKKYYEIPFDNNYSNKSEEEIIEELDQKLYNAVKRQLLSDVPLGFFLSGGLDSSLIVAYAKKILGDKKIVCFTIDTKTNSKLEDFEEDLPYALKVAEHLGVEIQIIDSNINIINDYDKMIWHLDEPQADVAPLNVSEICVSARKQGIFVLLGGAGGDDLFSGYRRHQVLNIDKKIEKLPYTLRYIIHKLSKLLPSSNGTFRRIKKIADNILLSDKNTKMASYYNWIDISILKRLFNKENTFEQNTYFKKSLENIKTETNDLNKMLYWEIKYFLADHNLNYTDKMSMAHGVEVRVPFLDKELVEFSTKIPPELKMKGMETKYILKKVAERYLPKEVIYRSKTGFGAPVRDWINKLEDKIIEPSKYKIFNKEEVKTLIDKNNHNLVDATYPLLAIMSIKSWLKQFA